MKKKTGTTFIGMLLAIVGALTTPVYPGGLVKQLPVDGTWAEYTATVELVK